MAEVWFYHLERWPLDKALPALLEKAIERGWRTVVQATGPERVSALDGVLWTYDDASFLPHGTAADGDREMQPVYLTDTDENPNGAVLRILVDGADPRLLIAADPAAYQRIMVVFDGTNAEERARARQQWAELKSAGHSLTYWKQTEEGQWQKGAQS